MQLTFSSERRWLGRFGAGMICVGLLLSMLHLSSTSAAGACRADPVVTFPNGISLDLHTLISADRSTVRHISYQLHGDRKDPRPPTAVTYPDGTGPISQLAYVPDAKPHQYYAIITVTITGPARPVTAYLDWMAGGKHNTGTAHVSGLSGQGIRTPVLRIVCANKCARQV